LTRSIHLVYLRARGSYRSIDLTLTLTLFSHATRSVRSVKLPIFLSSILPPSAGTPSTSTPINTGHRQWRPQRFPPCTYVVTMPAWFKVVAVFRLSIGRISTTIVHLNDLEEIFFHRQRCECTMVILGYHA